MRFSVAWAATAAQNVTLKAAVASLAAVSITLAISTARLSFRKPILIERGCSTRLIETSSASHSVSEIEVFVREAIRQRFNSEALPIPDYLDRDEEAARSREQKELATRGMTQFVYVRGIKVDGNKVMIDADRLIAVAQIRSAFPFPLVATLATTTRTESNPYGLKLMKTEQPKQEAKQ